MTTYHEVSKKRTDWNGEGLPPVGVECEFKFTNEAESSFKICKVLCFGNSFAFMKSHRSINGYKEFALRISDIEFRKPETPQERQERERIEAAIRLHDIANLAYYEGCLPFNCSWSDAGEKVKNMWLAVVDETKYRKEAK
ncbi:hypothetical protein VchM-138_0026 [Vibrio phage vB_VchM-138]|uniref:hypothetical protein n=1 Tax=Vibrio phage vB_VchM-138 TaxID=1127518 RepID=UPI0002536E0A|nr:hypothetical protein F397_gp26 [Vibrio phage vB_VchM-138]AFC22705.1 hypothetical protein VchM-138_0026 [Vibrio phage vB_VchM-138]